MNIIKKLWVKSKFYGGLVVASVYLTLLAMLALLTLVVFAPVIAASLTTLAATLGTTFFVGVSSALISNIVIGLGTTLILGTTFLVNRWIWSNSTNMSTSSWQHSFYNAHTIDAILESFNSDEERVAFLIQKDATGQTALSTLITDNSNSSKKTQALILKILNSIKSNPKNQLSLLLNTNTNKTLWSELILSLTPKPAYVRTVLQCLNAQERMKLLNINVFNSIITGDNKTTLEYAVYFNQPLPLYPNGDKNELITAILNSITMIEKMALLNKKNSKGETILEYAIDTNNLCSIHAILSCFNLHDEQSIEDNKDYILQLITRASQQSRLEAISLILSHLPLEQRSYLMLNKHGQAHNFLEHSIQYFPDPKVAITILAAIPEKNRPKLQNLMELAEDNFLMQNALSEFYQAKKNEPTIIVEHAPPVPVDEASLNKKKRKKKTHRK